MSSLAWSTALDSSVQRAVDALRHELAQAGFAEEPDPRRADAVVAWADRPLPDDVRAALLRGDRLVVLAGRTLERGDLDGALAEAAGVLPGPRTPVHDVRVRPAPGAGALAARFTDHAHTGPGHLGEHVHVRDAVLRAEKVADDVEVWLTAHLGLEPQPVAAWRPETRVLTWTLGADPGAVTDRAAVRLLALALRAALGEPPPAPVGVALLGYGAIGHEHSRAVAAVDGLHLAAVADPQPTRREAALAMTPATAVHDDGTALLDDPAVSLVVVSTPPSTHAEWALRALRAGKHVVVEKPFALRTEEADAVLAAAAERDLLACVYQNRRFDPDHLALRRLVREGALGEVFSVEAFVGGYGHPCNLWHSDVGVSGGAFYDWGSHVLDQVLDLVPGPVESVTATEQKRRWFDVTNADHSRVHLRFAGGEEAEFVHSDLAAALKPRWFVLGTEGAVVGHWRQVEVTRRNEIGTLASDVLAPADAPPDLELHAADGSVTRVAAPPPPPHGFHRELADRLLHGLPMSVTGQQSRRVLAVLEAAAASAADGGRPVTPA